MNDEKKKGKQKPGASLQEDATQKIDTAAVNAAAEAAENGGSAAPAAEKAPAPKRNRYADKMNRQKKPHKKLRIAVAAGLVVIAAAAGTFFFLRSKNADAGDTEIQTAVATRGTLETFVEGSGTTSARKREELGRDIKGKVSQVLVSEGDEVVAGQVLVAVDPTETRKELETAQKEMVEAQRTVAEAQNSVTQAQNTLVSAQNKLNRLSVTAPISGRFTPVTDSDGKTTTYRVGEQVSEGQTLGYIVNDSQMKLSIYFSAAYSGSIKAGQYASVSIPSAMSEVGGVVSSVESSSHISSDGVKLVRVNITVNNPGTLTKGMAATATVNAGTAGVIYPAESGSLEYSREVAVTSQVSGEITAYSGAGTYSAGGTIMRMTSDALQDEVRNAQSAITAAQSTVQAAQSAVTDKQTRISELQLLISRATVVSPIDGVVVTMNAVEEQEVSGADPLVVVADLNDIIVNASIMSTDMGAVQTGQSAIMSMYNSDGSQLDLTGTVESVALEPDKNSSGGQGSMPTFSAVISVDPIEGQSIHSGMMVDYKITTASSEDCLTVPSSAIVNTEEGTAVFAKPATDENGNEIPFDETLPIPEGTEGIPDGFQLVPVEIGIADSTNTEILWGIDEGITVFLAGPTDLYADMNGMGGGIAVG